MKIDILHCLYGRAATAAAAVCKFIAIVCVFFSLIEFYRFDGS